MQFNQETLLNPPFAKDPPVKLNVPAKTLGLVYAILAAISAFFGAIAIIGLLGLGAFVATAGAAAVIVWLALIGLIVSEVGTVMAAWGGYQMYQLNRDGKRLVIYGLVLNLVGSLISALGGIGGFGGWIVSAAIAFALYYLVIISRFPDEPPLVATGTGQRPSA